MKRDMELVRSIVFAIEGGASGFAPSPLKIEGYSDEQVGYHVYIMLQGGLLEGCDATPMHSSSPVGLASCLTWAGHEFADTARDGTVWNKAMTKVTELGGSISLALLMQLLTSLAKTALQLP